MNSEIFKNPTVVWFLIGLGLLLIELIVPGLILVFFGAGAWIVALLCLFLDINLNMQILVFIFASSLSLALLRKYLRTRFFKEKGAGEDALEDDEFIGRTATVVNGIKPDKAGKIEFRGTLWGAQSDVEISEGEVVKIIDKKSINLIVKPNK